MTPDKRRFLAVLALFLLLLGSALLLRKGLYGLTLFVLIPVFAGGFVSWLVQPQSARKAGLVGTYTALIGCGSFLLINLEGITCVLMALPLAIPLSVLGSYIVYKAGTQHETRPVAMAFLLPLALWSDTTARPPVYPVETSIVINAPPARVWPYATAFSPIAEPNDWFFRTGIPYPKQTRIQGSGVGAARYCDLSTGPVVERVTVWNAPHLLRFQVLSTPPAMHERGLYGPLTPRHLNGYYISRQGQFELVPLPGNRTLLRGTSWYQHGLWPAEYWRWWTDAIVHRIHTRVLQHIRALAETT